MIYWGIEWTAEISRSFLVFEFLIFIFFFYYVESLYHYLKDRLNMVLCDEYIWSIGDNLFVFKLGEIIIYWVRVYDNFLIVESMNSGLRLCVFDGYFLRLIIWWENRVCIGLAVILIVWILD